MDQTHQEKIDAYYKSIGEGSVSVKPALPFFIPKSDPTDIRPSYNSCRVKKHIKLSGNGRD